MRISMIFIFVYRVSTIPRILGDFTWRFPKQSLSNSKSNAENIMKIDSRALGIYTEQQHQ
jgi:hypothetical protein